MVDTTFYSYLYKSIEDVEVIKKLISDRAHIFEKVENDVIYFRDPSNNLLWLNLGEYIGIIDNYSCFVYIMDDTQHCVFLQYSERFSINKNDDFYRYVKKDFIYFIVKDRKPAKK